MIREILKESMGVSTHNLSVTFNQFFVQYFTSEWVQYIWLVVYLPLWKIRPHRFGGEGVLIGGQNSNTKCSMTFVNIAVAISALAGGGQKRFRTETAIFQPSPNPAGVFVLFRRFLDVWASERMEMEFWVIFGHFGKILMEFWVILAGFRQWKNDQKWKNIATSDTLKGFWMPEYWKHCKN